MLLLKRRIFFNSIMDAYSLICDGRLDCGNQAGAEEK